MSNAQQVSKNADVQKHEQKEMQERQIHQPPTRRGQEPRDIFSTYRRSVDKLFEEVERAASQYRQSRASIQSEHIDSWRKTIENTLSLQHELWSMSPFYPRVDENEVKIAGGITETVINAYNVQNRTVVTAVDATREGVKIFSRTCQVFAELYKAMWYPWISWQAKD